MAIHGPNTTYWIKDDRICNWVYEYLIQNSPSNIIKSASSCVGRRNAISCLILNMDQSKKEKMQYFNHLIALANENLINMLNFKWLDEKNDRLCYWVWCYMNKGFLYSPQQSTSLTGPFPQKTTNFWSPNFQQTTSLTAPTSSSERVQAIISYFDNLNTDLNTKNIILDTVKMKWGEIYTSLPKYNWLDKKDEETCKRVWDYIREKEIKFYFLNPINANEIYGAIIVTMDMWFDHPAAKELFLIKLTRSMSRKKFLANNIKRKYQNIFMGIEEKKKLDQIAAAEGKKINEMLELLINNEYKRIKEKDSH